MKEELEEIRKTINDILVRVEIINVKSAGVVESLKKVMESFDQLQVSCNTVEPEESEKQSIQKEPQTIEEKTPIDYANDTETMPSFEQESSKQEPDYEPVPEKLGEFTVDQYIEAGWSIEQLLNAGMLKIIGQPKPTGPIAELTDGLGPDIPRAKPKIIMLAKAKGATYEQFLEIGWTLDEMESAGFCKLIGRKTEIKNKLAEEEEATKPEIIDQSVAPTLAAPGKNAEGQWIDMSGTIFDPEQHSTSKAMENGAPPKITQKGLFFKRHKVTRKTKEIDTLSEVDTLSKVDTPPPPPANSQQLSLLEGTPPPPTQDEIPSDLASLVKNFQS